MIDRSKTGRSGEPGRGKSFSSSTRDRPTPDTGGSYAVKRYYSEKIIDGHTGELVNLRVTLKPKNPDYEPPEFEHDVAVVAELVSVIGAADA